MKDLLAVVSLGVAFLFFFYFIGEGYFVQAFYYGLACFLFAYNGKGKSDEV